MPALLVLKGLCCEKEKVARGHSRNNPRPHVPGRFREGGHVGMEDELSTESPIESPAVFIAGLASLMRKKDGNDAELQQILEAYVLTERAPDDSVATAAAAVLNLAQRRAGDVL